MKLRTKMQITILTKPPINFFNFFNFYLIFWGKNLIKKILLIPNYGPSAVLESLIRGLNKLKVDCQLNPRTKDISGVVCVLSGVSTLKWPLEKRKRGKLRK